MDEDSSTEQKQNKQTESGKQPVYSFGKRDVFRLHLNESREGFCRRGVIPNTHSYKINTKLMSYPRMEILDDIHLEVFICTLYLLACRVRVTVGDSDLFVLRFPSAN